MRAKSNGAGNALATETSDTPTHPRSIQKKNIVQLNVNGNRLEPVVKKAFSMTAQVEVDASHGLMNSRKG